MSSGNLFTDAAPPSQGERFETILSQHNLVVERIVSSAAGTPCEYVQVQDEWVVLVQGEALLQLAGESVALKAGDYLFLPAGVPHRVERVTDGAIWLAVHLYPEPAALGHIRQATPADAATIAMLIAAANRDVALNFGLDADNCPRHPSLCTEDWVKADLARGEHYFILEQGGLPIACVAYEQASAELAYLNRLSVLPGYRQRGIGARLVRHVIDHARACQVSTLSIGVIGEHAQLQRWYRKLGFSDGQSKRFAHLPFSVKYMAYALAVRQ